jgi:CPA1 family monovalent cation:H+ antiporter
LAKIPFQEVGWRTLVAATALVLVGRAATVYPLSFMFAGSRWKLDGREQHVLWWGGLRGALALALALALPSGLPLRDAIVTVSFAVVAVSVLVQGLTMAPLMRRLRLLADRT